MMSNVIAFAKRRLASKIFTLWGLARSRTREKVKKCVGYVKRESS